MPATDTGVETTRGPTIRIAGEVRCSVAYIIRDDLCPSLSPTRPPSRTPRIANSILPESLRARLPQPSAPSQRHHAPPSRSGRAAPLTEPIREVYDGERSGEVPAIVWDNVLGARLAGLEQTLEESDRLGATERWFKGLIPGGCACGARLPTSGDRDRFLSDEPPRRQHFHPQHPWQYVAGQHPGQSIPPFPNK
ncbi:hypothetical protein NKR19_g1890 [Coniochaeta hoffmannii]|uniref:Uncharacterized protein n=1 Tax=Coniochaeta hoffmannii TaxID=91930 RepID=A0AA38SJL3_9PEZI|nr:hypothetical protein NKR19_g1890 [Coniochaeta hoffmannii]